MTIKKALDRISWRLSNGWKANEKDIEALNTIAKFVNQKHDEDFNNNTLFAKLYVYIYGEFLKYYEATVFDNIPQKELHKELDKPFSQIVEEFIDKHHLIEMALQMPPEIRYKHPKQIRYKYKDIDFEFKHIEKIDYKEAKNNLVKLINLALNEYS